MSSMSPPKRQVYRALSGTNGMSVSALQDETGMDRKTVRDALRRLKSRDKIMTDPGIEFARPK